MDHIQNDAQQQGNAIIHDSLSSIWYFAWKRMTQTIPVDDTSDEEYALCHTAAIEALLQSVDQEGIKSIFGIATFAFIDVYKEPFAAWSRHMRGARAVLDLHSPTLERFAELCSEINGLQEVVSLLFWYDTTGLMIRRDRGLIFEDWHREFMDNNLFELVGCPKDVFQIFTTITREGFECESRHPDLYVAATKQLLKASRGSHDHGDLLRDAWRCSTVMAIYEAESGVRKTSFEAIMHELTDRICDILQAIPAKSAKYRHLPFAAFMVGRLSQSSHHSKIAQSAILDEHKGHGREKQSTDTEKSARPSDTQRLVHSPASKRQQSAKVASTRRSHAMRRGRIDSHRQNARESRDNPVYVRPTSPAKPEHRYHEDGSTSASKWQTPHFLLLYPWLSKFETSSKAGDPSAEIADAVGALEI
ncbi:hypothetical protein CSAL01_07395 [Colletotrichum salicis]|uniref:Uncharacterized protein n=1 Tax=Colletotrichum salicis TaxID=1209931 RepID=A0A135S170_9PEZI|nr:hypothetical protein CSAL01_07395 [Colletotrichum salicis]